MTSTSPSTARLEREVKKIGCPQLLPLDAPATADHLAYLDLMTHRSRHPLLPHAVAEFQGRPILYLVDGLDIASETPSHDDMRELGRLLANRSEHAVLGLVRPGELTLYPLNLSQDALKGVPPVIRSLTDPGAPMFFQSLATGLFSLQGQASSPDYVFDEIHSLLTAANNDLSGAMRPLEVLSVTGRALFFRFLHDRKIVTSSELNEICPKSADLKGVFADADRAASTSCWLDETFNGDLLPLVSGIDHSSSSEVRLQAYRAFYRKAGRKSNGGLFRHLDAIMRGWKHIQGNTFQTTIDWDDFDFAHIPIGVLSQVYETFSRRWDEDHADKTSVHYTPKNIARILVEEALTGIRNPDEAVVLDPACGAGAFLVLIFRHLVQQHWRKSGERPNKAAIHRILYKQIRGFDTNESALRLAALALYVTAIELNGTTRPPKSLKFPRALKDEVLFNFGRLGTSTNNRDFELGSLDRTVPDRFNGQFDLVIGNPPWTRLRADDSSKSPKRTAGEAEKIRKAQRLQQKKLNDEFTSIARRVLSSREIQGFDPKVYENPDKNPDLPFVWRAAEWAKPDGIIAMALPARIILKQSAVGKIAREALMRGLTVTGILNGSDLEETPVWRYMKLPFMLLFARNSPASPSHQFHFVTPIREDALCKRAEFRIDYGASQVVSVDAVVSKPWMLKALSVGSRLDVEVWEKIAERGLPQVSQVWKGHKLPSSEGYHLSGTQQPADDLFDLPDFEPDGRSFEINFRNLDRWWEKHEQSTVQRVRTPELYKAPLVIIPQAPGETRQQPKAYLSLTRKVAFSKSYYGYSTAGYINADLLASLLYLLTHSLLWQHRYLTHSSRIGASFRTILKEDIDSFPLIRLENLSESQRLHIMELATRIIGLHDKPWDELDDFVFELYGLTSHDAIVVRDTVRFGSPYQTDRVPAARPPSQTTVEEFCRYLADMVRPFAKHLAGAFRVTPVPMPHAIWNPPWRFVAATVEATPLDISSDFLLAIMQEAARTAASRVVMVLPQGGLLVGLLNQTQFWSLSRARLCGLHIVRQHMAAFSPK